MGYHQKISIEWVVVGGSSPKISIKRVVITEIFHQLGGHHRKFQSSGWSPLKISIHWVSHHQKNSIKWVGHH
jgi:hypothetical protein